MARLRRSTGLGIGPACAGAIADSAAHAWLTGPTPALSQYVLGIHPTGAGYASWNAAPQPAQLSWAQGVVPTPPGPISVRWQRGLGSRSFQLTVIAPRDTNGVVEVPLLGGRRTIAMDGMRGSHTFAWVQRASRQ